MIFPSVEATSARFGHVVGARVEVEFPDGWAGGWEIAAVIGATDRPYRLIVRKPGREVLGAAPEHVRPEGSVR